MKDLTKTHTKKIIDKDGNTKVVVKPTRVEKTVDKDGNQHVTITVPKLNLKGKRG